MSPDRPLRRAFGRKLVSGFGVVGIILAAVTGLIFISITRLISSSGWVQHSYQILDTLDLTAAHFSDAQSAERGFVATCNAAMISPFRADLPRIYGNLAELHALTADNPAQQEKVKRLRAALSAQLSRMSVVMSTTLKGNQTGAEKMLAAPIEAEETHEILFMISSMETMERKLLAKRLQNVQFFGKMTLGACALGVLACGGILVFVLWLVRRETRRRTKSEVSLQKSNLKLETSLEELRHYNEFARSIGLLGELLQTCRNTKEALSIAGRHLVQLLPETSGAIGLFNAAHNQIETSECFGESVLVEAEFMPDDCWALRRGRLHKSTADGTEPACSHFTDHTLNVDCLPMIAQGDTLGVLSIGTVRKSGFSEMERRTIQTITEQLSLALANLLLQETLRNQSLRDPLTGLFNRRFLEDALSREIGRARRHDGPLSVVMIDVDHFKRFNDTHGHDGGDALLAELGQTLSRVVRGEDVACRYGGEEFAVILPGADLAAAALRAEELRTAIKRMVVRVRGETLGPVSASLGVAALHIHGRNAAELMKAADEALYDAKAAGRDRVVLAKHANEAGEAAWVA